MGDQPDRGAALIAFLGHYRRDATKCDELCQELMALPDSTLEACLPQMCQALLQSERAGAENQYFKPLERCLADACSRSVLFALQANWWFQSNMADQIFRQRCSELWLLCENACTAEPPSTPASRSYRELAEERTRDTLSAAHSFARACLADGVEQRHAPREALLASVSAALSAVDTWRGDGGSGQARPVCVENCRAVAESAKLMLEFDGEAVMPAYHAFLNVAADMEVGETDNDDNDVGDDQASRSAVDLVAGDGSSASSRGGGCCHPDLYRRQLEFVSTLSSLSGSLRNVPVPQRQQKLQEALGVINQELSVAARSTVAWLEGASAEVEKSSTETASGTASGSLTVVHDTCSDSPRSELPLPQPVIFPLDRAATGPSLRRVLRIVPDSGRVLKSRERTPLLLHVELFTENAAAQILLPNLGDIAAPQAVGLEEENLSPVATGARTSAESESTADRSVEGSETGAAHPQAHRCYGVQFVSVDSDSVQPAKSQTLLRLEPEPEPEPEPRHEPRATAFESVLDIENRLRKSSPFGHLPTWGIGCLIVKSGDDIRQEQLAMQLISEFERIFSAANLSLWLRPYRVLATDPNSGLIELVPSVMSIHALKESYNVATLRDIFVAQFGPDTKSPRYRAAQRRFTESMAGYSLVCYFLQIKDRHNGNILCDSDGHIIHIDFGFMLSTSPGELGFEAAPFKLSQELVDVMRDVDGPPDNDASDATASPTVAAASNFSYFESLCVQGFLAARRQFHRLALLLQNAKEGPELPCFVGGMTGGQTVLEDFRERFVLAMTDQEVADHVHELVQRSVYSWRTVHYDVFQKFTNGIL